MRLPTYPGSRAPLPRRPYRDSALLYGGLALVVLVFALLTGGDVVRSVVIALAFFVLSTGWTWYRFRQRLAAERRP